MRYVCIPLLLITGSNPGIVYSASACWDGTVSGCGSGGISDSRTAPAFHLNADSLERIFESALSPSAPRRLM
jgi:hypothetical protein